MIRRDNNQVKKHTARNRCGQRGAVLMDAMIAMFVAVVIILSLLSALISAQVNAQLARENNAAYNSARQIIENIRLYRGASLTPGTYNKNDILSLGVVAELNKLVSADVNVNLSLWRDPVTAKQRNDVKLVKVTVSWRALGGTNALKSRTFVSLVTPEGVVK